MIAAQQYYIEYGNDMNSDRLMNLLPTYIPDYCLNGDQTVDPWHHLITQAFRKVRGVSFFFPGNFNKCPYSCLWHVFLRINICKTTVFGFLRLIPKLVLLIQNSSVSAGLQICRQTCIFIKSHISCKTFYSKTSY